MYQQKSDDAEFEDTVQRAIAADKAGRADRIQAAKDAFIERQTDYYIRHSPELIAKMKEAGWWDDAIADMAARIAEKEWTPWHACGVE